MKPTIRIISTFDKIEDSDGSEHFTGTLDIAALRKIKSREIEVVLVPVDSIPKTLGKLMAKSGLSEGSLVMFGGTGGQDGGGGKHP